MIQTNVILRGNSDLKKVMSNEVLVFAPDSRMPLFFEKKKSNRERDSFVK